MLRGYVVARGSASANPPSASNACTEHYEGQKGADRKAPCHCWRLDVVVAGIGGAGGVIIELARYQHAPTASLEQQLLPCSAPDCAGLGDLRECYDQLPGRQPINSFCTVNPPPRPSSSSFSSPHHNTSSLYQTQPHPPSHFKDTQDTTRSSCSLSNYTHPHSPASPVSSDETYAQPNTQRPVIPQPQGTYRVIHASATGSLVPTLSH